VKKTTGKVYFDVTDDTPDSVVYNAGGQDLLVWVQPPPQPPERWLLLGWDAWSGLGGTGGHHPGSTRGGR
jgi:hypothetical protein